MITKNKKNIIIAIIFLVLTGSIFGYYYSKEGGENTVVDIIGEKVQETFDDISDLVEGGDDGLNYGFNTKFDFDFNGMKGGFELKDGLVITKEEGLKQNFKIGSFSGGIAGMGLNASFSDLDLVSDNEITYLKLGEVSEQYEYIYDFMSEKTSSILKEGKYIKIDNSKPIINVLGDLSKNELIKKFAIGLATNNPITYYKKDDTYNELVEYISSDELLKFLFKDGDYDEATNKTNVILNEQICTLTPLINNILKESGEVGMEVTEEVCNNFVLEANSMIGMVNIYKEGDIEKGDYKFVLNQGKLVNINLEYKNHDLEKWSVSFSEPEGMISFKANGDNKELKSSLFKVNIEEGIISIVGEIEDGTGDITIKSLDEELLTLNGNIVFKNYLLSSYSLKGESDFYGNNITLDAEGNLLKGKLLFNVEDELNLDLQYKGLTYDLDIKSKMFNVESSLNEDSKFYTKVQAESPSNETIILKGDKVNDGYELDLTFSDKKGEQGSGSIDYLDDDGKVSIKGLLNFEPFSIKSSFNLEHSYSESDEEYSIPNNFEEIEVTMNEIVTLPNLEDFGKMDNKTLVIGATAVGAGGTIAFISLQGYSADARNAKVYSDISTIVKMIEITRLRDGILKSDIALDDNTINFELLGQDGSDFKHPDGSDYLIFVKDNMYQVYGTIEMNGYKESIVKGNYFPENDDDPESLVEIDGFIVEDGDMVY